MSNTFEGNLITNKESEKKLFGNNVLLDIDLARHGKKSGFNSSRIENVEETSEIAKSKDVSDYDIIAVRTTPVERAVHTALATRNGLMENKNSNRNTVNVRVKNLPTGILSTGGVNIEKIMEETDQTKDINLISPHIRELYKQAVQSTQGSTWEKENAGVELFINLMKSNVASLKHTINDLGSLDDLSEEAKMEIEKFKSTQQKEGGMSIIEVVLRMVKHLQNYTKATNKFKNDTKIFIHEVNHSGFIEPFLIYLLDKEISENPINANGRSALEKIGGGFEPNESIGISIKRKEKGGKVEISFKLRDKVYYLDINDKLHNKITQSEKLLNLIKSYE